MTGVIVVPTHRTGARMLENLLASLNGYEKYPILVVANDWKELIDQYSSRFCESFRAFP